MLLLTGGPSHRALALAQTRALGPFIMMPPRSCCPLSRSKPGTQSDPGPGSARNGSSPLDSASLRSIGSRPRRAWATPCPEPGGLAAWPGVRGASPGPALAACQECSCRSHGHWHRHVTVHVGPYHESQVVAYPHIPQSVLLQGAATQFQI